LSTTSCHASSADCASSRPGCSQNCRKVRFAITRILARLDWFIVELYSNLPKMGNKRSLRAIVKSGVQIPPDSVTAQIKNRNPTNPTSTRIAQSRSSFDGSSIESTMHLASPKLSLAMEHKVLIHSTLLNSCSRPVISMVIVNA